MKSIEKDIKSLSNIHTLLKKYSKKEFSDYFEDLIREGDIDNIDYFLNLPFPKNKEVGIHIWNPKSNAFSYHENYAFYALIHRQKKVFEYFQKQHSFNTNTIIDSLCAENNIEMIDYILNYFPPTNIKERTNLLFSAIIDNYIEQFRLLSTHEKTPIDIYDNNYELLKKSCEDNKDDFVAVLMIDCNMQLNEDIRNWLNGDNADEKVYTFPFQLETLRTLNQKLKDSNKIENVLTTDKSKKHKI